MLNPPELNIPVLNHPTRLPVDARFELRPDKTSKAKIRTNYEKFLDKQIAMSYTKNMAGIQKEKIDLFFQKMAEKCPTVIGTIYVIGSQDRKR